MRTIERLLNSLALVVTLYLAITSGVLNAKLVPKDPPWPVACPLVSGTMPCDLI